MLNGMTKLNMAEVLLLPECVNVKDDDVATHLVVFILFYAQLVKLMYITCPYFMLCCTYSVSVCESGNDKSFVVNVTI